MNRLFFYLLAFLFAAALGAQTTPDVINYQAAIKNNDGTPAANQEVTVEIQITTATDSYEESRPAVTDGFGIVNIQVGGEELKELDWASGGASMTVSIVTPSGVVSLGAIPVFHYGADTEYTPASGLGALATRYPEHPIMAIHMGGGGAGYVEAEQLYHDSRALGLKYPNIKYVLSARRDTHTESDLITYQLAGEPFSKNICCASDAPYGKQSWNFGGYRLMFETLKDGANHPDKRLNENPGLFDNQAVSNYMGKNFAELTIWAYQNIIK